MRLIQERTIVGLARGRLRGRKPVRTDDPRVATCKRLYRDRILNIDQICETRAIPRPTFYRHLALSDVVGNTNS